MHKITINLIEGEEVRTHVAEIPTNASELTGRKLFDVLDRLKHVDEGAEYEVEYVAAWVGLDPMTLRAYTADIYDDVQKLTEWFNAFVLELDSVREPEIVELCGHKISTSEAYSNLTLGSLELMRAQTNYSNAFKVLYNCLRYRHPDASGRYITVTPEHEAIKQLEGMPAAQAYALLNFFFARLTKRSAAGPITRLTNALTTWVMRQIVLRNTGRLT